MSIKPYRVTLTAMGPIFVGSGKKYMKKEYLMLPKKFLGIADMNKIYALAYKKKIAGQFEDFMLGRRTAGKWGAANDLGQWLEIAKLKDEAVKTCIKYTIDVGDTSINTYILACMKDAYGTPYIPGSSLKGALRTIWATSKIMEDDNLRNEIKRETEKNLPIARSKKNYLADTAANMEARIFRKLKRKNTKPGDAVNDIMQGFIVGDSDPIADPNALVLAQKVEHKTDGTEKNLNLLRESLRPGTKITFDLAVDESICHISAGELLDAVYSFDESYNKNFLSKFKDIELLRPDKPQIYLGGGAGFLSKTVVYPVMGKGGADAAITIFDKTVPRQHKHFTDKRLGVSPRIVKCTRCNGKIMQFGLCEFAIEEL